VNRCPACRQSPIQHGASSYSLVGLAQNGGGEIDLNRKNSHELRDLLKPYTEKGRKVTSAARRPPRVRTASDEEGNKRMRAWAKEQGFKISERGRVPAEIAAKYEAANAR
jgi:hypothetical protein